MGSQSGCCGGGRREPSETERHEKSSTPARSDTNKPDQVSELRNDKTSVAPTSTESRSPGARQGSRCR